MLYVHDWYRGKKIAEAKKSLRQKNAMGNGVPTEYCSCTSMNVIAAGFAAGTTTWALNISFALVLSFTLCI